jgi:MtN3 and saliva related transmembrane protein
MPDLLGWLSSVILVATIAAQIHKQWQDETSRGVSPWLFVGESVASLGFTIYSVLVDNWVFVVTNVILLCAALLGLYITFRHRRRGRASPASERTSQRETA